MDEQDSQAGRDDELDGLRIRQLATMRRAAYRSRSHAIIALLLCLIAAVESILRVARDLMRRQMGWWSVFYLLIAAGGLIGTLFFARRAMALHLEATQTRLLPPTESPDFSSLNDGSQRYKNLEELR
jgi:hypothetical protein